jgi:chorismate mutase
MDQDTAVQLKIYRDSIDNFDKALLHILAERFKVTGKVGILKRDSKLPPADLEREQNQIQHLRGLAESLSLNPDFIEKIYWLIIEEVTQNHIRLREETQA